MVSARPLDVQNEVEWLIKQFAISGSADDIDDLSRALKRGLSSYSMGDIFGEAVISALRQRACQIRESKASPNAAPSYVT